MLSAYLRERIRKTNRLSPFPPELTCVAAAQLLGTIVIILGYPNLGTIVVNLTAVVAQQRTR